MDEFDKQNTPARNPVNILESLFQEFGGISFYGLEYIVEDILQSRKKKSSVSSRAPVDWFGLNE